MSLFCSGEALGCLDRRDISVLCREGSGSSRQAKGVNSKYEQ